MFSLSFKPYTLQKKHVFRIAGGARTSTPAVLVRLRFEGVEGFGEASMPPRYGESIATATDFLQRVDLSPFRDPFNTEEILHYVDKLAPGNPAVKASVDIALHDLIGKMLHLPLRSYFGLPQKELPTSKTIGIDTADIIRERVREAGNFRFLKIKLGGDNDREIINAVREETDKPLYIDANQGWKNREEALEKIAWLREENTVFIEQPMPKNALSDMEWLAARSPLPIVGDEGIQRFPDVMSAGNYYHAINIKLMKSTGLREAYKMAVTARAMGLRVMLGCMSETSCAIAAASQLGALADWIDLDGNLGIKNDPFSGPALQNGIITPNGIAGVGLVKPDWDKIEIENGDRTIGRKT
ncbi:dipeptide epimerase [Sinomicrobium weinanense]|uniref:Dipeptide epimerase n=1 Tax=Sinomicrobium weinanense TaxID=2842200 RepID=A0A926JRZ5_9FLAO|nr:dipeptide epimerase [Sinomicrobium weinanense]MBC9796146.1 dipeptide epimerase [Sinomicrobium weinanense]MBU3121897.1 dipeptide epimerase [Sinomicrobium weinanense]